MKHNWINIEKCYDRRKYMEEQFNKKNIDNIRIEAETPNTIKEYQIRRNEKSIEATQEELSCIISHLKAIKKGYEDGDPYFCIVEDDMVLNKINFDKPNLSQIADINLYILKLNDLMLMKFM